MILDLRIKLLNCIHAQIHLYFVILFVTPTLLDFVASIFCPWIFTKVINASCL